MKHRRRTYFLTGVGLLALLVVGTGIYQFDRVLNDLLRPLIERTAASRLAAEVRIGRITLASAVVTLSGFSLHRPNRYRLSLPHTEIGLSLSGLMARRIDRVQISAPALELWKAPQPAPAPQMPSASGWGLKSLKIEKGRFTYWTPDHRYLLDQIAVESGGGASFGFRICASVGEAPGLPLSVDGRGTWGARQEVTVERIQMGDHQLLATPLQVFLPKSDGPLVSGAMALARFTSNDLAKIAAALGTPAAPGGWHFELHKPTVNFRLDTRGAAVALQVAAADIQNPTVKLPLEGLTVALSNPSGTWQGEGRFLLAGTAPGEFSVRHDNGGLRGAFALNIPQADALGQRLLDVPLPGIAGGLSLQGDFTQNGGALSLTADLNGLPAKEKPAEYGVDLQPLTARLTARQSGTTLSGEIRLQVSDREVFSAAGSQKKIRFQVPTTPWQALTTAAGPALLPAALLPGGGGSFSGSVSAEGEVSFDPSGIRMRLDSLAGREIDYLSADGMTGLGGGRLKVQGTITAAPDSKELRIDLDTQMNAREILRGSFYADASGLTATADLRATLAPAQRRLQAQRIGVSVEGLGGVAMSGRISPGAVQMDGTFSVPSLKGLFADILKSIPGESVPGIDTLQLSGALAADFSLKRKDESWHASGSLRPDKVDLAWPTKDFRMENASGALPFYFSTDSTSAAEAAVAPRVGNFTFDRFAFGPLMLEPAPIRLHAETNRLFVDTPLVFGVARGRLEIEDISTELAESGLEVLARIRIVDVDLDRLTRNLEVQALTGRLAADLGQIRYAGDVLNTAGTMEISVFGGDILVRNMRLESPLTPYASFFADIDFNGLDLFQLTRTLSFGEMNGIADGYVHQLRLFGKTPSRFAAAFATRESGKRNISVKALNNLTVISQGGISEALSRGIYQFIDFYRYRKIGIACTLEKDVFRLQGTARADSAKYLVDGGLLPPRIDVVISSPTISFTEMVKRLQRIERTGG